MWTQKMIRDTKKEERHKEKDSYLRPKSLLRWDGSHIHNLSDLRNLQEAITLGPTISAGEIWRGSDIEMLLGDCV